MIAFRVAGGYAKILLIYSCERPPATLRRRTNPMGDRTPDQKGDDSSHPVSKRVPELAGLFGSPEAPLSKGRWPMFAIGLVALALVAGGVLWSTGLLERRWHGPAEDAPPPRSALHASFPLPPVSKSRFRNTTEEATYVGSDTCASCHKRLAASFRSTGMGGSMATVDAAREPADATFDHASSKSRFQIQRKDGQLWHRELLLTAGSGEVVLAEYPVKYVVGSGRHARTYLAEAEGFLVESPVSWYTSAKQWDLSPGYDRPDHIGFQRGIDESCLTCHAGRAEAMGKAQHRMLITEAAIGCERCHGPGSLHVQLHRNPKAGPSTPAQEVDTTIVNPAHLSRELAEAVCQQCHLVGPGVVLNRGKRLADFRPGLPLEEFRLDFEPEADGILLQVVGHVEQLHLSRCHTQSKTLTCTTCHNPHAFPRTEERVAYYRGVCLKCHEALQCTVGNEQLLQKSPDNDCTKCHMPQGATDVPHVAFSHHRIAVHERPASNPSRPKAPEGTGTDLRPFRDYAALGEMDRKRGLGLAFLVLADKNHPGRAAQFQDQAFKLLAAVHSAGLRDPVLQVALARLRYQQGQSGTALAVRALDFPDIAGTERANALSIVASELLNRKHYKDALAGFQDLVTLRRNAGDWLMLAECQNGLGNSAATVQALEMALRINPRLRDARRLLVEHYRRRGDEQRAAWHELRVIE
jgi:hypothetical protein